MTFLISNFSQKSMFGPLLQVCINTMPGKSSFFFWVLPWPNGSPVYVTVECRHFSIISLVLWGVDNRVRRGRFPRNTDLQAIIRFWKDQIQKFKLYTDFNFAIHIIKQFKKIIDFPFSPFEDIDIYTTAPLNLRIVLCFYVVCAEFSD